MRIVQAPGEVVTAVDDEKFLFLAGSIEMGAAELWQDKATQLLAGEEKLCILNPRRDDWDSSWKQSIDNDQFREQVEWELNGLEVADIVLLVFDPNTKSPITLLELGLLVAWRVAGAKDIVVVCPDGFWRKGNVDVVCHRYDIMQSNTLEEGIDRVRECMGMMR